MWWWLIFAVLLCFALVIVVGAPYVPTLKQQQADALDLLELNPGQNLLELGCGDGRMLLAAAKRGIGGVGYELNPFLVVIAYCVTWKYRKIVKIRFGNFWQANWPPTEGIYVFLHTRFMAKLDKKVIQQYSGCNVKLVSYAFAIPGRQPVKTKDALYLYEY